MDQDVAVSDLSKDRLRAWLRILKVTRMIEAELRERMRTSWDMTLPRFDVMAALSRVSEGMKMSDLSGVLRVSNGNVTGIVDRLVTDGLVERRAVEGDRRANRVVLTPEGRVLFDEMAAVHERWVDELLSPIGAQGLETLRTRLGRIIDRLEETNG
ncbi:MarR family transcriptional regulator [Sulfitobacter sp. D35]|uniref:MarR family winged helix-turn-helix transcriptional regulator n=1 Tax=Sulfitobacter sp. D35 TaxID=3083252 RepID=UPI00296E5514|nr:MarR family transcriptional regulator [Sulfitobacter sp. D35]MDW4498889.1 MarR family transcriptional regulator [Sulfitobacter sp. D35]